MDNKKITSTKDTTTNTSPVHDFWKNLASAAQGENHHHAGYHRGAGCAVRQWEYRAGQVSHHRHDGSGVLFRYPERKKP